MLTSLGQPTIRLRRYGWNTRQRKEVYGEKNKKNQSVAWHACEAPLGKERYDRLNE